jgi:hypothetical protein
MILSNFIYKISEIQLKALKGFFLVELNNMILRYQKNKPTVEIPRENPCIYANLKCDSHYSLLEK